MADPVSFTASVLTLLAAAGSSCRFLYNVVLDIKDTPVEIRSQNIKLQCLYQTISNLIRVYDGLPREIQLEAHLRSDIVRFIEEIDNIRTSINEKDRKLNRGRMNHWKERLKWLSYERQFTKFYNSLDQWEKVFQSVASTVTTSLLSAIYTELLDSKPSSPAICTNASFRPTLLGPETNVFEEQNGHAAIGSYYNELHLNTNSLSKGPPRYNLPKRLRTYVRTVFDPVGFTTRHWFTLRGGLVSADIRVGPVIARYWCDADQDMRNKVLSTREGYCISPIVQLNHFIQGRFLMEMYIMRVASRLCRFSLRWNIRYSGLLPLDSPAYLACAAGDKSALRGFLTDGVVSIVDATASGDTLLQVAIKYNQKDIVTELFQLGADVTVANDFGETALHTAVRAKCDYDITRHLINQGADLSQQDVAGRTPLHGFFNMSFKEVIQYHQDDIDTSIEDTRGMTVAHLVAWSTRSNLSDLLPCLKGLSLETRDRQGRTMLHLTLQRGNFELTNYLLNTAAPDMFRPDWDGLTLLHHAAMGLCTESIDILLERGYDIHATDHKGRTALHYAAMNDNLVSVQKLLEHGAVPDLGAVDRYSRTPLQLAAFCKARTAVEYLRPMCSAQKLETPETKIRKAHKWRWCWGRILTKTRFSPPLMLVFVILMTTLVYTKAFFVR